MKPFGRAERLLGLPKRGLSAFCSCAPLGIIAVDPVRLRVKTGAKQAASGLRELKTTRVPPPGRAHRPPTAVHEGRAFITELNATLYESQNQVGARLQGNKAAQAAPRAAPRAAPLAAAHCSTERLQSVQCVHNWVTWLTGHGWRRDMLAITGTHSPGAPALLHVESGPWLQPPQAEVGAACRHLASSQRYLPARAAMWHGDVCMNFALHIPVESQCP